MVGVGVQRMSWSDDCSVLAALEEDPGNIWHAVKDSGFVEKIVSPEGGRRSELLKQVVIAHNHASCKEERIHILSLVANDYTFTELKVFNKKKKVKANVKAGTIKQKKSHKQSNIITQMKKLMEN